MGLRAKLYDWFLCPHRIAAIRGRGKRDPLRVLDVGCGNHSPKITKRYLPGCEYHGLCNARWNLDEDDDRRMDRLFSANLDRPGDLAQVPDDAYDVVFCSHVLEHLSDPYSVARALCGKLRPGGILYVETPSERSLRLPRAAGGWLGIRGCLNFHDDDTHKTLVDLQRVAAVLADAGLRVSGPRRAVLWRRIVFLPLYVAAVLATKGFIPASLMWDVTGFAESLTAARDSGCGSV